MQFPFYRLKSTLAATLAVASLIVGMPRCDAQSSTDGTRISPTIEGAVSSSDVESVSNELFRKEIEFAKLTTTYRLHNVRETKTHKWVTALASTGAYATADAGNIITFTNAYKYRNNPQNFHVGRAECGPGLIFMGELSFFGRTVAIDALDYIHDCKIRHEGFDRATFENHVSQLETDIHALLARRQQLIASNSDPTAIQEQAVLQDIADSLSKEFVRNYARASRIRSDHLTENIDATLTAGTGAFAGGLLIYLAAQNTNPRLTGPAGIGFITSGIGFILKDFLRRRVSQHVEKKTTARLMTKHNVPSDPLKKLETDRAVLSASARRKPAYDLMTSALNKDAALSTTENKEEWHKYLHDQTINAAEGFANIAAGTILCQAGFQFRESISPLQKLDEFKSFLTKFGAAAITFTPTASLGLADTPGEALYGEYRTKQDCKKSLCPKVGLAERMDMLNQAETSVK